MSNLCILDVNFKNVKTKDNKSFRDYFCYVCLEDGTRKKTKENKDLSFNLSFTKLARAKFETLPSQRILLVVEPKNYFITNKEISYTKDNETKTFKKSILVVNDWKEYKVKEHKENTTNLIDLDF